MAKEQKNIYQDNASVSFQGEPEKIDVEKEVNKEASADSGYNSYKLAQVLLKIGEQMTGIKLYSYQKDPAFRIIYSMLDRDGAEITMLFARQSGKSEVITFSAVTLGVLLPVLAKIFPKELGHFSSGVKMGLLAPQGEQVETVYRRCMERLLSDPVKIFLDDPDVMDAPLSTVNFKLKSGTFLTGQSAAKQSKIESKTYHIVFMDESQDMDTEKVRRSIMPMLASTFGTAVRTGTPSRNKGDFYYTIQQNKRSDKKLRTKKEKQTKKLHFQYNYKEVIKAKEEQYKKDGRDFHTLYKRSVDRDIKSMGKKSEYFRLAYNIEWLLEVGMFISEEGLDEHVYNRRITLPKIDHDNDFIVAGLDIASARNDTVLTTGILDFPAADFGERPVKTLEDWLVLSGNNYELQFQAIARHLLEKSVKVLYADYTGVGRALTDILAYHLGDHLEIVPYTFTPSSKSDMWKALDEDIINRRLVIPAHDSVTKKKEFAMFEEQMTNLQKYWKGSLLVCNKTQGFSDDFCDSLGLMNLAGNHLYTPPQNIEVTENNLTNLGNRAGLIDDSRW